MYVEWPKLAAVFRIFLHSQFENVFTEQSSHTFVSAKLTQDTSEAIFIDTEGNMIGLTSLITNKAYKNKDLAATENTIEDYKCTVRKLLYIDRRVNHTIVYYASPAATKFENLCKYHSNALNSALQADKDYPRCITYKQSSHSPFKLEAMFDASMQAKDDKTNVLGIVILFQRCKTVVDAIGWASCLARRVKRSTNTAVHLTATDAVDRLTYFKHLLQNLFEAQTPELVVALQSAFHLCLTIRELEEIKNKIKLASIREKFRTCSMVTF